MHRFDYCARFLLSQLLISSGGKSTNSVRQMSSLFWDRNNSTFFRNKDWAGSPWGSRWTRNSNPQTSHSIAPTRQEIRFPWQSVITHAIQKNDSFCMSHFRRELSVPWKDNCTASNVYLCHNQESSRNWNKSRLLCSSALCVQQSLASVPGSACTPRARMWEEYTLYGDWGLDSAILNSMPKKEVCARMQRYK